MYDKYVWLTTHKKTKIET